MILAYEFEYVSQNLVLENFLKVISEEFGVAYEIHRRDTLTTLYVNADEQKQHEFADFISSNLPVSLFLRSSNAKVVDSITGEKIKISNTAIFLPFTKKSLELARDEKSPYFNSPFVPNEVGEYKNIKDISLKFESKNGIVIGSDSKGYSDIYRRVAKVLADGEKVKIDTPNGNFTFFRVEKGSLDGLKHFEIIPTDLSLVQKMVNLKNEEIEALATLEKPIIRAKVNMVYESFGILPTKRVDVRLANTLLVQFICEELKKNGVEFLVKSSDLLASHYRLSCDLDIPKIPDIKISVLENGEIFILNTTKYSSQVLLKGLNKFKEPSIKQFVSIIKERDLFEKKSSCLYFSKRYSDSILYHDDKKGVLPLVDFPKFPNIAEIFRTIKKQDESGAKLVKNYKKEFLELYKSLQKVKIPKKGVNNLFNTLSFVSLIVGFSDNFKDAAEILIQKAEDFGGQKGVRIDFKLLEEEKINSSFDPYKLLRSAMSFKLAGTDDMTLSFGVLESFSYFISDIADAHKESLGSEYITLGGSLFSYPLIAQLCAKNLLPNHKICFNKELPIEIS